VFAIYFRLREVEWVELFKKGSCLCSVPGRDVWDLCVCLWALMVFSFGFSKKYLLSIFELVGFYFGIHDFFRIPS